MKFPKFDSARDWILFLLVLILVGSTIGLAATSGMGAGGIVILCLLMSTTVLIVGAKEYRIFYVGLYGLLLSIWNLSIQPYVDLKIISMIFGTLFIAPTVVAWLANQTKRSSNKAG